jgi:hypothetical protein
MVVIWLRSMMGCCVDLVIVLAQHSADPNVPWVFGRWREGTDLGFLLVDVTHKMERSWRYKGDIMRYIYNIIYIYSTYLYTTSSFVIAFVQKWEFTPCTIAKMIVNHWCWGYAPHCRILLTIHRYSQPQEEQIIDRDSTLSSGPYVEMSTATFFFFNVGRREGTYLLFADLTNKRER